jgi:taurine dioxygenase
MTDSRPTGRTSRLDVRPLGGALGATVEGLVVDDLDDAVADELRAAWAEHLVLFFPGQRLSPAEQVRLAGVFGPRLAATTDAPGDHRGLHTLDDEGFPQLLVLDTAVGHNPKVTANWHTDVTFTPHPPIGSLFSMQIPASPGRGDTIWSNQHLAYEGLSAPIRALIDGLEGVHGRPPLTDTTTHPMVKRHPSTGRAFLYVNRGWTTGVRGLQPAEAEHLLAILCERSERAEYQVRWHWSAGDAALWDNRCTMHYAVNDYPGERRRAVRATIYDDPPAG